MSKSKLEYLWLDGYKPVANLRGKTKIIENFSGKLEDVPMWGFDGSSTQQAITGSSDWPNQWPIPDQPEEMDLVMTEVLVPTMLESNERAIDDDDDDFWFGSRIFRLKPIFP